MCDFKPGDEVVCVDANQRDFRPVNLTEGAVYKIAFVGWHQYGVFVRLVGVSASCGAPGFYASRFRKVQRRDLAAWLKTSVGNTDKLDKRQTKKVRA